MPTWGGQHAAIGRTRQAVASRERQFAARMPRHSRAPHRHPGRQQNPVRAPVLERYLREELRPAFEAMGFAWRTLTSAKAKAPFAVRRR